MAKLKYSLSLIQTAMSHVDSKDEETGRILKETDSDDSKESKKDYKNDEYNEYDISDDKDLDDSEW